MGEALLSMPGLGGGERASLNLIEVGTYANSGVTHSGTILLNILQTMTNIDTSSPNCIIPCLWKVTFFTSTYPDVTISINWTSVLTNGSASVTGFGGLSPDIDWPILPMSASVRMQFSGDREYSVSTKSWGVLII